MTLQQLAEDRMIKGKKNHLDQSWETLSHEYLVQEAREELADAWNYSEKFDALAKNAFRGHIQNAFYILDIARRNE